MDDRIILSILIPTKNREKYAINVIHQILNINSNKFQLVIQDNSNSNDIEYNIKEFQDDKRLSYYHENRLLSFVDNFNLGINRCKGEYIIIIGDDDGINPNIISIAEWASENKIDAITPSLPIIYFWPHSKINRVSINGTLQINKFTCNIKSVNPKLELIKFLQNGCLNYLEYNLAKLYHGIIRKSVLDKIKDKTGRYVGGLTPDIYLSVATSLLIDKVIIIDYPLTISGICGESGSSDSATGKHTGKLSDAPHFKGHEKYEWSNNIPPFYSVETIWADSALAAINDLKKTIFLKYFRMEFLSIYCMLKYPQFKKLIINHLKMNQKKSKNKIKFIFRLFFGYINVEFYKFCRLKKRILNKINGNNKQVIVNNIENINKASDFSIEFIDRKTEKIIFQLSQVK